MAAVATVVTVETVRRWLATLTTPRDLVLMLALAVAAAVETLAVTGHGQPVLRATLSAATMLGIALRRTHPLAGATLVAVGVVTESVVLGPAEELAVLAGVLVAMYGVAAYSPLRDALVGAAVLGMAVAVAMSMDPSDSPASIPPTLLIFVAVPGGLGISVHRRRTEVAALRLESEALSREADAAVDAERRRIARELHDLVSHAVTLIAVQAEAGQSVIDRDVTAARRSLEAIGAVSREALGELGRLLALLRDEETTPDATSGLDRLSALVQGARAAGLTVVVEEQGVRRPLPCAADHCAYRVVQEGLTNALRHAAGARVSVEIRHLTDEVRVRVDSTGTRHQSAYGGTGHGLVGLRERVLALGGTIEAGPTPSGGFGLSATLPVTP